VGRVTGNLIAVASGQHDLGGVIRGPYDEALVRAKLQTLGEISVLELSDEGGTGKCISPTLSDNVMFVVDDKEVYINFTIDLTHGIKSDASNAMLAKREVDINAEVIDQWIVPSGKAPMFRKQARKKSGGRIVQQYIFEYDLIE
jgi:hypothetical protein